MPRMIPVDHNPFATPARYEKGVALSRPVPEMRSYTPLPSEQAAKFLADYIGQDYADKVTAPLAVLADPIYEGGRELAKSYQAGTLFEDAPQTMMEAGFIPIPGIAPAAKAVKGIRAYHGSPHDFDQFSMDKIGTGEGAQAYGHGLYFAESEGVAKSYRDTLQNWPKTAQSIVEDRGYDIDLDEAREILGIISQVRNGDIDAARGAKLVGWRSRKLRDVPEDELTDIVRSMADRDSAGAMYEVNIKADPDEFLDWDKPLSQQSKQVQDAVRQAVPDTVGVKWRGNKIDAVSGPPLGHVQEVDGGYKAVGRSIDDKWGFEDTFPTEQEARDALEGWVKRLPTDMSGQAVYRTAVSNDDQLADALENLYGVPGANRVEQGVAKLREAGIPGIKYLDQGSRDKGDGTRNFVLFRDDIVEIVRKYGIAGAAAITGLSQAELEAAENAPPSPTGGPTIKFQPIDHDPFKPRLTPVEHDPFAQAAP